MDNNCKGQLLIIGGAEDKVGESAILKEAVEIIGKENGILSVITTATNQPESVGKEYDELFKRLGAGEVNILNIGSRDIANEEGSRSAVKKSSGIFFTGGDQLRLTSILGGTSFHKGLVDFYNSGGVIIGTSAGASVMTGTMIVDGNSNDAARKCTLKMAPGLGLLHEAIIDQHFAQRGRIGRLLCGVAENPEMLGIGIDEDTAIVVKNRARFHVIGSGAVYIIDGSNISHTNVSQQNPEEVLSIFDIKMHVLKKGDKFDLLKRVPFEDD